MMEVRTRVFMGDLEQQMIYEKNRRFKKDIQIQINQRKYGETPMNSNTQLVEGGGVNPRVHGRFNEQMRFEKNRKFNKYIQIQIGKPK